MCELHRKRAIFVRRSWKIMKILVIVAHPDDEVIICGGTINKLIKHGHKVHVVYCTLNQEAYFGRETSEGRVIRTKNELKKSAKLLGFSYSLLGFEDMYLQKDKGLLIKTLIKEIRTTCPDVIITHFKGDKHIDHRTLGEIVPEANFQSGCNLCGGDIVWSAKLIVQGEVDLEMSTPFDFQVVSSISEENLKTKLNAFKVYESIKSEHNSDQTWLTNKLKWVAALRGRAIGARLGEAFIINNYKPIGPDGIKLAGDFLGE